MQTFYRIIQTILKAKNIFFPSKQDDGFMFWKNVFQCEQHDANLIFYNNTTVNISTNEYNNMINTNNLTKQAFYFMISSIDKKIQIPYYSNRKIKAKFFELNNALNNMFISKEVKNQILNIFCKCQKTYYGFLRLAFVYKYKKAKMQMTCDLYMNGILENQQNSVVIFQNNAKYTFIVQDLIKIIDNALTNAPSFFLDPLQCKNPYTNIPFNRAILYYIYFQIKSRICVVPELFHRFFLCNFNIVKFKLDNETFIKEIVFKNYIKNTSCEILCNDIRVMLEENRYTKKLLIDDIFPEKKLVEIFAPYLELYYQSIYFCAEEKKYLVKDILCKKLDEFYKNNKLFGRKVFTKVFKLGTGIGRKYTLGFNEFYIPFSQIKIKTWENMDEDWSLINQDFANNCSDDEDDNEITPIENENNDNDNQDSSPLSNESSINESINSLQDSQNDEENNDNNMLINNIITAELEIEEELWEDNPENNFFSYDSETDSTS